MRWNDIIRLDEKVLGGLAIGYHRTKNLKVKETIGDTGFKAGDGAMYGRGVYLTYDFDDQQDERMKELYGPIIVRAKVNLAGFLIFDADVAKAVYGIDSATEDGASYDLDKLLAPQFARFKLPVKDIETIKGLNHSRSGITSAGAQFAVRYKDKSDIRGLVFTGASDGRVIVAFNPADVVPFGWARVTNLAKTKETVKWNKYEAPPINQKVAERLPPQEIAFRYFKRQGFSFMDKGAAGGHMSGRFGEDNVLLTISNRPGIGGTPAELTINAIVSRVPIGKFPLHMMQRLGWRLDYHVAPGEAPLTKIMANIRGAHANLEKNAHEADAFAKRFLSGLVKPGVAVASAMKLGADYGTDVLQVNGGPVKIVVKSPYDAFVHGDVIIDVEGHEMNLGFNDGSKRGATGQDMAAGYELLLHTAEIDGRVWRSLLRSVKLPEALSDRFRADLLKAFQLPPQAP